MAIQFPDGRMGPWQFVEKSFTGRIDGGVPDATTAVIYADPQGKDGLAIQLAWAKVFNRNGSAANMGFGVRLSRAVWKAGQWTNGTTTFTDDTTHAQSSSTGDFPLEVAATNNDGFLVSSAMQFNAISLLISTASTGSPVRALEYSTGTSTWTALSTSLSFGGASANMSTGENVIWFSTPADWVPMASGHGTGVTVGHYGLRVRATTAPTVAAVATSLSVHMIHLMGLSLATGATGILDFGGIYAPMVESCDAIVGCSSQINSPQVVQVLFRSRG